MWLKKARMLSGMSILRGLCGECIGLSDGLGQRLPAIDASHDDWPGRDARPQQHRRRFAAGKDGLRLDTSLEFLMQTLDRMCRACAFSLIGR
jgi:hypothetical protein